MYVARILYPVRVLGPGRRIGIWFCGCLHKCPGCSNPELWSFQERYNTSLQTIVNLIYQIYKTHSIDGFTLTGGDPFYQPEALRLLLPQLKKISNDILVYTGYDYEPLTHQYPDLMAQIGVLIDGKYIEDQNIGLPLRGSDNQRIIILNDVLSPKYTHYVNSVSNQIQNFTTHDGVISVGIHRPGYNTQIDSLLQQKGLEKP